MSPETQERLQAVQWLITRYDAQRTSLVNRAAVVLSANAIVATGVIVLTVQATSTTMRSSSVILALAGATLLVGGLSVIRAAQGLINVRPWSRSRRRATEPGLYYGASDTVRTHTSFEGFRDAFVATTDAGMFRYGLVELWTVTNSFYRRYLHLRRAVQLLLVEIILFILTAIVWMVGVFGVQS